MTTTEYLDPRLIEELFCNIPSESLLYLIDTEAQLDRWQEHRRLSVCVALAWISSQNRYDLLQPLVKKGELSQEGYDICYLVSELFQRQWTLVRRVYPFIEKELGKNLPFNCAYELFCYIVVREADWKFGLVLLSYVECSVPKMVKNLRAQANSEPVRELFPETKESREAKQWLILVLKTATKNANSRNRLLKYALEDYDTSIKRISLEQSIILKKGRSFAWKRGQIGYGQRGGGYKFDS